MGLKATIEDVRHAYRLLLGREPDEGGAKTYAAMLAAQHPGPTDIASIFLDSPEYAEGRAERTHAVRVDLDGYSMFVRRDDGAIGACVFRDKAWEPHVTQVLRRVLAPGMTFLDVGANIGFFTALAAHLVGKAGKVIAIEPLDKNVQLIYASCSYNNSANVFVFPFAASDSVSFLAMDGGAGTSNGSVYTAERQPKHPTLWTQTAVLDDVLRNLGRLDAIKMDIEGFEPHAWKGLSRTLEKFRPIVVTEYHPQCLRCNGGVEPDQFVETLLGYGAVGVIAMDGREIQCDSVAEVNRHWQRLDDELAENGGAHLDLIVRPH